MIGDILRIELDELVATAVVTSEVVTAGGVSMIGTDEPAEVDEIVEVASTEETDEMAAVEEAAAWSDATT